MPPDQIFVFSQDRARGVESPKTGFNVARLAGRNPCDECSDLPAFTDRTVARSCLASAALRGTPPPRPRGAAVCLPFATNLSSSFGVMAAILVAIFVPAP